ncbi:MAG: hypothetical protein HY658_02580 [Actinobacteria bacterium]|nr:hypothetical protein [Actinomycetota bacterium]
MARKRREPVDRDEARAIGALLRGLRRTAGYRAVQDAARAPGCPAARQTIYAYERGGLVPSLRQFLDLVRFYALGADGAPDAVRYEAIAAIVAALSLPAYHVTEAFDLMRRLHPAPGGDRPRRDGKDD